MHLYEAHRQVRKPSQRQLDSNDAVRKHGLEGLPVCPVLGFREILEGFPVPMLMLMRSLFPLGPAAASVRTGHREAVSEVADSRQG